MILTMQNFIDPRIQKDVDLLKNKIKETRLKISEHEAMISKLEESIKEEELRLAVILPYTVPFNGQLSQKDSRSI
jgi:hypothetical protein